jgi:hypothetical protein
VYFPRDKRGLHLVQRAGEKIPSPFFRVGEEIPESGVYRVFHNSHRVSHEVVLLAGEKFPRCSKCDADVHFELLQSVPEIEQDSDFIRIYEIPHPERVFSKNGKISA